MKSRKIFEIEPSACSKAMSVCIVADNFAEAEQGYRELLKDPPHDFDGPVRVDKFPAVPELVRLRSYCMVFEPPKDPNPLPDFEKEAENLRAEVGKLKLEIEKRDERVGKILSAVLRYESLHDYDQGRLEAWKEVKGAFFDV